MGSLDRMELAQMLAEQVRESLGRARVDRVKYGATILHQDVETLNSILKRWEYDGESVPN